MNARHWHLLQFRVAALLVLPWVTAVAIAEEPAIAVAGDATTPRAQTAFREAVAAFASGRYHSAIELFSEADRIEPNEALAFDIARSYEKLGNAAAAAHFYREYLRRAGHPSDEAEVRKAIDRLEPSPDPRVAPPEGPIIASAQSPSGPFAGAAEARAGTTHAPDPVRDRKAGSSAGTLTTLGWVGLGMGAAALGGALACEVLRANAENDAEHEREQIRFAHDVHTMETDRTASRVLLGTGAALAVAGGVLLAAGAGGSSERGTQVSMRILPGGVAAGASWWFQ